MLRCSVLKKRQKTGQLRRYTLKKKEEKEEKRELERLYMSSAGSVSRLDGVTSLQASSASASIETRQLISSVWVCSG